MNIYLIYIRILILLMYICIYLIDVYTEKNDVYASIFVFRDIILGRMS